MNFDLNARTIFLVVSGSRSYGFSNADSDWDYRGIAIPPMASYLSLMPRFEQCVDTGKHKQVWKNYPEGLVQPEADMQIMELTKFCRLAMECNPNIIEILFTDPQFYIRKHSIMDPLLNNKHLFLSKQAKARFCGYALSQLNRIKRHKRFIDNPPKAPPARSDYGLPEYKLLSLDQLGAADALIIKEINEFMIDQTELPEHTKIELSNSLEKMMRAIWKAIHPEKNFPCGKDHQFTSIEDAMFETVAKEQGFSDNFIEILKAEKKYRAAKQDWDSYQTWLKERNPVRAELERKYGFDTKHATHLKRLLHMAREILERGEVVVHRPDAEELRAIRNGVWTYEQIVEFAEKEDEALTEIAKNSKLPKSPPFEKINKLVFEAITEFNTFPFLEEHKHLINCWLSDPDNSRGIEDE